ncbi:MAG: trypsin-like serine protease [Deltaproteobacteria bacterium]|nr:trypsin-like serine protease [Deltaproteobacteria bacterium]
MRQITVALCGIVALLVGCGLAPDPATMVVTNDGFDREGFSIGGVNSAKEAVINGTNSPTLFTISENKQNAIGALREYGQEFCTGTLIAPQVVVSAAHCVGAAVTHLDFAIGPDSASPSAVIPIKKVLANPNYNNSSYNITARADVAVYILKNPATQYFSAIEPIPFNDSALSDLRGKQVQNVGYGVTSPYSSSNTRRYWTAETVAEVSSYDFTTYFEQNNSGTCNGDSGGPSLYQVDGELRVVATVSWGDSQCQDEGHYALASYNAAWISQQIENELGSSGATADTGAGDTSSDSAEADPDPCQGITYLGVCHGAVAVWCQDGQLAQRDCAADGQTCGYTGNQYGYYCMAATSDASTDSDPCQGYSYAGTCEGAVAVWCEDGQIKRRDCAGDDLDCGWIESEGYYYCR